MTHVNNWKNSNKGKFQLYIKEYNSKNRSKLRKRKAWLQDLYNNRKKPSIVVKEDVERNRLKRKVIRRNLKVCGIERIIKGAELYRESLGVIQNPPKPLMDLKALLELRLKKVEEVETDIRTLQRINKEILTPPKIDSIDFALIKENKEYRSKTTKQYEIIRVDRKCTSRSGVHYILVISCTEEPRWYEYKDLPLYPL